MAHHELPASVAPHKNVSKTAAAGHELVVFILARGGYATGDHGSTAEETDLGVIHIVSAVRLVAVFFAGHVLLFAGDPAGGVSKNQVVGLHLVKIAVVAIKVGPADLPLNAEQIILDLAGSSRRRVV